MLLNILGKRFDHHQLQELSFLTFFTLVEAQTDSQFQLRSGLHEPATNIRSDMLSALVLFTALIILIFLSSLITLSMLSFLMWQAFQGTQASQGIHRVRVDFLDVWPLRLCQTTCLEQLFG